MKARFTQTRPISTLRLSSLSKRKTNVSLKKTTNFTEILSNIENKLTELISNGKVLSDKARMRSKTLDFWSDKRKPPLIDSRQSQQSLEKN
jgi:hypothetical protein